MHHPQAGPQLIIIHTNRQTEQKGLLLLCLFFPSPILLLDGERLMKGELRGRLNVLRPRRVLVSDERFLYNARTALFSTDDEMKMKVKEKKKNKNNNSFSGGTQQQPVHAVHTACLLE